MRFFTSRSAKFALCSLLPDSDDLSRKARAVRNILFGILQIAVLICGSGRLTLSYPRPFLVRYDQSFGKPLSWLILGSNLISGRFICFERMVSIYVSSYRVDPAAGCIHWISEQYPRKARLAKAFLLVSIPAWFCRSSLKGLSPFKSEGLDQSCGVPSSSRAARAFITAH